ncbi:MAG: efflux RND transporter permease subunit [Bryobacteraceae bacterium]
MWLIHAAMRRPVTILMAILGVALCSILAMRRMQTDIFPDLGTPVIYVAQPYGGLDPAQMEGYLVNYYEYHFLYIRGIDYVESRSIQGAAIMKLYFHEGTDMATAMAETVAQVNRSRAFMPPGTVPPFVTRFDAGSVPVGYLVFSSASRGVDEISDLALFRVRPMFSRLPGVSAPPPFGGTARTLVVRVDPDKLRSYQMSPDEVVQAIAATNTLTPSGNVRIGDLNRIAPVNATVREAAELNDVPVRQGPGPTVYLRDIGYAEDGADILTCYALVNGRRAVYIAATKRADASTLDVVRRIREALPAFQAAIPEDIKVDFAFDQSFHVTSALRALLQEGLMSAALTGVMILLMLRSFRAALVVVTTIPVALLSAVVALWAAGQSLNLMTLGGLTLAIGVLVDESVVAVENIHVHLGQGKGAARAVLEASREVVAPRFLAMLAVVSVFAPSFFMEGVARALFAPLALAVGFSMVASYFLASSLVPIMETWLNRRRAQPHAERGTTLFDRFREGFGGLSRRLIRWRWAIACVYLLAAAGITVVAGGKLGADIFPQVDTGLLQMRLRAPTGTRVERTEQLAQRVLAELQQQVGAGNIESTLSFVGVQPSSFPVNLIFLWTSGPHEAVMQVALKRQAGISTAELQEKLRRRITEMAPGTQVTFEAADLVSQVMSFGAPTPVEIAVTSANLAANRKLAESIVSQLRQIPALRDVQLGELLDYPALDIRIDRERAAQLGVTVSEVGRAIGPATWSSRFTHPVYWADPRSGIAYQVQVELPQSQISSIDDLRRIPVKKNSSTMLGDVAELGFGNISGEYHRFNMQRMVTVTGNVAGSDLGGAASSITSALKNLPEPPRGVTVAVRGQIAPLTLMLENLRLGLLLSIVAVFLLLAAYFQSIRVAFVVLLAIPSVLAGVAVALLVTGATLNIQSFMGAMMAVGISVANTILLCTFADQYRRKGVPAGEAAAEAARTRARPVLMTSIVMITGMAPLALGAAQTAPLGIAVMGGLAAATVTTLFIIPSVFAILEGGGGTASPSIDPDDPGSPHYDGPDAGVVRV